MVGGLIAAGVMFVPAARIPSSIQATSQARAEKDEA
jgi:hypothetical protein